MSKNKKKGGFFKFLLGASVGAAAGVLLAPKEGSETRKELKASIEKMIEEIKNVDKDEVKENIESKIEELKTAISDLDKETVLKVAKKKATEVKDMAEELVKYAKDKGTPVLKEASVAIQNKAIEVTKEVLNKLEK